MALGGSLMATATDDFASWIAQGEIPSSRLTPEVEALLRAVFRFRQQQGTDYYSTRLLSHFLLHADTGLKVAPIARLLGISRPNASAQQKLSSKQAIAQAHHRMDGRPSGKLLPRYAGPIAAYLLAHPDSSRADLLDFIEATFGVRVSRIALYKFLQKYGLQDVGAPAQPAAPATPKLDTSTASSRPSPAAAMPPPVLAPTPLLAPLPLLAPAASAAPAPVIELARALEPGGPSAPPFSSGGRNTPAPFCCWEMPSTGWRSRAPV
jgi:hypothetical protein